MVNARTGHEISRLTASDGQADDHFGWSVAVDGTTIAVGAPGRRGDDGLDDRGAVYLYRQSDLAFLRTLTGPASSTNLGEQLGTEVALDSGSVFASTSSWQGGGFGAAPGRILEFSIGGGAAATIYAPPASGGFAPNTFPSAFSVSGSRIVATEVGEINFFNFRRPRRVHVFARGNGTATDTFESVLGATTPDFAQGVATDGTLDYFTDPQAEVNEVAIRSASDGSDQGALARSGAMENVDFGFQIALAENLAAVGAPAIPIPTGGGNFFFRGPGSIHVFDRSSQAPLAGFSPPELADGDQLGAALDLSADHLAAWAPGRESVYIFSSLPGGDGPPNVANITPDTFAQGSGQTRTAVLTGTGFDPADAGDYRIRLGDGIRLANADSDGFAPVTVTSGTELSVTVESVDLFAEIGPRVVTFVFGTGLVDRQTIDGGVAVTPFQAATGFVDTHPADTSGDGQITGSELATFAENVNAGAVAGVPVNEEDVFLANATLIWKNGELYRQVPGARLPAAWVPDPAGGPDWVAVEQRAGEALDRVRLFGLPLHRATASTTTRPGCRRVPPRMCCPTRTATTS